MSYAAHVLAWERVLCCERGMLSAVPQLCVRWVAQARAKNYHPGQLHLPSPCLSSTHLCQLLAGGPASSYPPRVLPMSLSPASPPRDLSPSSHSTSHCDSPSLVMETNQPQTSSVPSPPAWFPLQTTAVRVL